MNDFEDSPERSSVTRTRSSNSETSIDIDSQPPAEECLEDDSSRLQFSILVNRLELENLDESLALRALDALQKSAAPQRLAGLGVRACDVGERFLRALLSCCAVDSSLSQPLRMPLRQQQALDLSTNWINLSRDPQLAVLLHETLRALVQSGGRNKCSLRRLDLSGNYLRGHLAEVLGRCSCHSRDADGTEVCVLCALELEDLRLAFCSLDERDLEYLSEADLLTRVRYLDVGDNNFAPLGNAATRAFLRRTLAHTDGRLCVLELRNARLNDAQLAIAVECVLERARRWNDSDPVSDWFLQNLEYFRKYSIRRNPD